MKKLTKRATKLAIRALNARDSLKTMANEALTDCSGLHTTIEEGGHIGLAIALLVIFGLFVTGLITTTFDPQLKTSLMNFFTMGS